MLQNAASDQGLHCLPLIQQYLNTSTDKLIVFKCEDQYGKKLIKDVWIFMVNMICMVLFFALL